MAKKSRRGRKTRTQAEVTPSTPAAPAPTRAQQAAERLQEEYAYVIKDLQRIFIIAAAMFALLVVLNLVLR